MISSSTTSRSSAAGRKAGRRLATLLLALAPLHCAQSSTVVETQVSADNTVPPVLILQMAVANLARPALQSSSQLASLQPGFEAGIPAPFAFPLELPISVDPSFAGTVTVTVQGLDWNTYAVIASGSTTAQVVAHQQTHAAITMSAPPTCDGTGVDGGGACDGGADGAGD
jgi:hypothetical protein